MSNVESQVKDLIEYKHEIVPGAVKMMAKEAGAGSSDLWRVPVDAIKVRPGYNPRIETPQYKEKLAELAESIKVNGFYDSKAIAAVVAKEGDKNVLYVEDGHRRFAAVQLALKDGAPIETLPVIVLPRTMSAEDRLVHMYKSNNETEPFTPLEVGVIVQRLTSFGWDDKQIAAKLGITPTRVKQLAVLVSAPKNIRDFVKNGDISATFAIETVQEHGDKAGEVIEEAVKTAKKSGKKATKKMTKKEGDAKSARLKKKHHEEAYRLLEQVIDKDAKKIADKTYSEIIALFVQVGIPY